MRNTLLVICLVRDINGDVVEYHLDENKNKALNYELLISSAVAWGLPVSSYVNYCSLQSKNE